MKKLFLLFTFCWSFLNAEYIKEPIFNEVSYVKTFGNPSNEAIVFVHGLGDEASDTWKESVEVLKEDYFILIFDLPGFGKSDKSNQLYSPLKYANFINTLVDNFVDKPFHLVGHSMGASISLLYSSLYNYRLKSLVLIDAAALLNRVSYSEFLVKNKTNALVKNDKISGFVSKIPGVLNNMLPLDLDPILNTRLTRKVLLRSNPNTIAAMALMEEDFSGVPQKIEVPTLILWGEEDKTSPLRTAYVLNRLIEESKLEIIDGAGHVPMSYFFDQYMQILKTHLKRPTYIKEIKKYPNISKTLIIKNKNNKVISGNFKNLEIYESKNIVIKNAKINNIKIYDSEVKIINSDLELRDKTYLKNSFLEITASNLKIFKSIDLNDVELDIAGVFIETKKEPFFKNSNELQEQYVLYSLSTLNGTHIHGIKKINKIDKAYID